MEILFLDKTQLSQRAEDFCDLYRSCFSDPITPETVQHRYLETPLKDDLLMVCAQQDGRLVANYAAVPMRAMYFGREVRCALSLNTMTHPDFAGQGLFLRLSGLLYEEMRRRGYAFVYGFPNRFSNNAFISRHHWQDIYEIPTMTLELSERSQPASCGSVETCTAQQVHVQPHAPISLVKDSAFLAWRYGAPEYRFMRLDAENFMICKKYRDELNLPELHAQGKEPLGKLLDAAVCTAVSLGCTRVTTWSHSNTEQHSLLEKRGFFNAAPVRYLAALALQDVSERDLYDYRCWDVSMGDDNVY